MLNEKKFLEIEQFFIQRFDIFLYVFNCKYFLTKALLKSFDLCN